MGKRVTRNVDPEGVRELLERAPRACIAFAGDDGPLAQPVALLWREGRYLIGIPADAGRRPAAGQEVVLLADGGIYYFELRAVYLRGRLQPAAAPEDMPAGRIWFEVVPLKTVAWDYASMREVEEVPDAG